jgi:hypothetical protein
MMLQNRVRQGSPKGFQNRFEQGTYVGLCFLT